MHAEIEALRTEIASNKSVTASVRQLIQGLVSRIGGALDNEDIQAARDMLKQLQASDATLTDAVLQGTSAASGAHPDGNNNTSPGNPGPPADQSPETANPLSPDAVPQATGVNASPAAADAAASSGDLPPNTPPGTPASA